MSSTDPSPEPTPDLTPEEQRALGAVLDAIVPGATDAGAVTYVLGRPKPAALRAWLADAAASGADAWLVGADDDAFRTLRRWAWEGVLCDPAYGGNRDGVGWARFGFAGYPKRFGRVRP